MKNKIIWLCLIFLIMAAMLLASCATSSTSTTTHTSTPTSTTTTATTTKPATAPTTTPTSAATTTTITTIGNWWDKLDIPQYGGTMTLRVSQDIVNFDPLNTDALFTINSAWLERPTADDWTVNPVVFGYSTSRFTPSQYVTGHLAETWEFTDVSTYVIHLRKGIQWQNLPPINARELTADDIVYHYDRLFGLGGGFTASSYWGSISNWQALLSVTATDKYTVIFKWKYPNPELITETIQGNSGGNDIEDPDAVKLWGDLNDWHHAIGTGPFILQDFVSGSSVTLAKNPNYWGYDERYPQNKLPYADDLKILIVPDDATALAALRSGKIDAMAGVSYQNAQSVQKTNPEILQITMPAANTSTVDPRNDVAPFKDIRVRQAMQMAIDLPTIAATYYGGTCPPDPSTLTSNYMTGWGWPYSQWPQDLQAQYAYNPSQAKALLAAAGYPNGFNTDIVCSTPDTDLNLMEIVKSYFAAININMEIRVMDSASWVAFVGMGRKHDALAARGNGTLGNSTEPTRQLGKYITGSSSDWLQLSDPVFDAFFNTAKAATSIDQVKQALIDANKYMAQNHIAISLLQANNFGLYQPWFEGWAGQFLGIPGPSVPLMLSFYEARFWVDQNVKKSIGN